MALGEHKSVKSINMQNGIPVENEITAFHYPYTRKQYEAGEASHRKEICEWFKLILRNIEEQMNANEGLSNEKVVKLQTQRNIAESQNCQMDEDNLPF